MSSAQTRPQQVRRVGAVRPPLQAATADVQVEVLQPTTTTSQPTFDWSVYTGLDGVCHDNIEASLSDLAAPLIAHPAMDLAESPLSIIRDASPTLLCAADRSQHQPALSQSTKRKASQEVPQSTALRASKRGRDKQIDDTIIINGEVYERRKQETNDIDLQYMQIDEVSYSEDIDDVEPSPFSTPSKSGRLVYQAPLNRPQRIQRRPAIDDLRGHVAPFTDSLWQDPFAISSPSLELSQSTGPAASSTRSIKALPKKLRQSCPASGKPTAGKVSKRNQRQTPPPPPLPLQLAQPTELPALQPFPPLSLMTVQDLARTAKQELAAYPDLLELATAATSPSSSAPSPSPADGKPKRIRKRAPPKGTPQPAMSNDSDAVVHVARPPNAWILYRSDQIRILKADPVISRKPQADISKLIGALWRQEQQEVKDWYERQALVKKDEHLRLHPDYRFSPQRREEKESPVKEKSKSRKSPSRLARSANAALDFQSSLALSSTSDTIGLGLLGDGNDGTLATPRNLSPTSFQNFANAAESFDTIDIPVSPMGSSAPVARFMPPAGERAKRAFSNGSATFGLGDAEMQDLLQSYTNAQDPFNAISIDHDGPQFASTDFISQAWADMLQPNSTSSWLTQPSAELFVNSPSLGLLQDSDELPGTASPRAFFTPSLAMSTSTSHDSWMSTPLEMPLDNTALLSSIDATLFSEKVIYDQNDGFNWEAE